MLMKRERTEKKYLIQVNENWCKGCTICVEFCPEGVLAMDGSKVKVIEPQACRGCALCELMCPDFAISVIKNGGE